jgi:hypothetical protein
MQQCERWRKRQAMASSRGWHHAAKVSGDGLCRAVDVLRQQSSTMLSELQRRLGSPRRPSASTIYHDLRALRGEFEQVTIDHSCKRLTVRTFDIELDGVDLGCFDIRLHWASIAGPSPYEVVAVNAHPACGDSGTTHPHVQDDKLCEGEGATIIRRALSEGRLLDFFTVVDRILRTYNADSAYVALDDWHGVTCCDCGGTTNRDDACRCEKCGSNLCDECSRRCCVCSDPFCTDCVASCTACEDDVCSICLQSCDDCGESFCTHCLNEGVCDDCTTRQAQETEAGQAEQPSPSIHAVRLGETVVST